MQRENSEPARVALVVPVYRGWAHAGTLLSGLGEPVPSWLDVLVVDDASRDGQAQNFARKHPAVRVIERETNGGFAAAVNTGIRATSADPIVVANSDLAIEIGELRRLAQAAADHPTRILGPRTVTSAGAEIKVAFSFPSVWSDSAELLAPYRVGRFLARRLRRARSRKRTMVDCDWVLGSCLAFSRAVVNSVGPLDETYRMYSEEIDWQRRARRLGIRAAYVPDVTVRHDEMHGIDKASRETDDRFRMIWRARLQYHSLNGGNYAGLVLRVLWCVALAVNAPVYGAVRLMSRKHRVRADAELRRSVLLARAGLKGCL